MKGKNLARAGWHGTKSFLTRLGCSNQINYSFAKTCKKCQICQKKKIRSQHCTFRTLTPIRLTIKRDFNIICLTCQIKVILPLD